MAIKTYEAFRAPSPYEQERLRAERQRRYAELLEQQAMEPEGEFTYQGIRAMPSPAAALGKLLTAYQSKKAREKAEEAEARKTGMEEQAAEQIMGRLMGSKAAPAPIPDAAQQIAAEEQAQREAGDIQEMTRQSQYRYDPEGAMQRAVSPQGVAAVRGNPMLAAALQRSMEAPKTAEYGTTPQFDAEGRAFVVNKAGEVRYLDNVKQPAPEAPTSVREFEFARTNPEFAQFLASRTPSTKVDVSYGAPVAGVDEQGNPVFFQPSRTGGAPSMIPGVRPEGKPPTESQSNAMLFAERMAQAEPLFQNPPPSFGSRFKEGLPGGVGNVMITPESRQFFQAERNFINAVLRKESGAVISDAEFENARRQYIPQPGDDAATLEQKRQARETATRQIAVGGGAGYKPPSMPSQRGNVSNAPTGALNSTEQKRLEELRRKRAGGG
jgi:hypothetical protein